MALRLFRIRPITAVAGVVALAMAGSVAACSPGASSAAGGSGQSEGALESPADTVFMDGTIYTADKAGTFTDAVAIRDGKILAVGEDALKDELVGPQTEVVELEDKMLVPGFIDAHIHTTPMELFDMHLAEYMTEDALMDAIRKAIADQPDLPRYNGFGFQSVAFGEEEALHGPTRQRLDAISPDKPVTIASFDGHSLWANTLALKEAGLGKGTVVPEGGSMPLDDEGLPKGTLHDAAMSLLPVKIDPDRVVPALKGFQKSMNMMGYTGVMAMPGNGLSPVPVQGWKAIEKGGDLSLRVHGATAVTAWNAEKDLANAKENAASYADGLVRMTATKFFADGVMDNHSAFLLEPYAGTDDYGLPGWELEKLADAYAESNEAGMQTHTHAIGDGAVQLAVDALAMSNDKAARADHRNAITHLQLVDDADKRRMNDLDVVAVAQPFWHYREGTYFDETEVAAMGRDRANSEYPLGSLLDEGLRVAMSSDYPVTMKPNPFDAIQIGVTRNRPGPVEGQLPDITDEDDPASLLNAAERVSVEDMVRGFTIDAAFSMHADDQTGSIEVGKSADLVVVDRDIFKADPIRIRDAQIDRTYFQGKVVYDAALQ